MPGFDYIDSRYQKEVKNGTYTYSGSKQGLKGIIDSQNDAGGYPNSSNFKGGTVPTDSDGDGMSEAWETAHKLDPNNAEDRNYTTLSSDGYTNLEMYLNELAGDNTVFNGTATLEPINGKLIQNLLVKDTANTGAWSIDDAIAIGDAVFGDRDGVTYSSVPFSLTGAETIVTACDSKNSSDDLATFEAGADITVSVLLDNRVTSIPAWLSGYTKTDLTAENSKGVTFNIYQKDFSVGETITLGTNGQSSGCVNYTVLVMEQSDVTAAIRGDVNADGKFDVADVVLLQKWLLAVPDTHLADWKAGDLCEDDRLDVFDLCLMKRELLK